MPRIYDCFIFFNELDLLEIRLHELDAVVDRFVLCEATETFRGKPKRLVFEDNRERFAPFLEKIEHVVVDDMPKGRETESDYFRKERFQRNALARGLGDAKPDDLVILSDIDEIPRASAVEKAARRTERPTVFSFEMSHHRFFVNLRRLRAWNRLRMARLGDIRKMQALRAGGPTWTPATRGVLPTLRQWRRMSFGMRRPRPWVVVENGGWHLSSMNGPAAVAEKLQSYSHVRPRFATVEAAAMEIERTLAAVAKPSGGSGFRLETLDSDYPAYLVANQERFAHLIADPQGIQRSGATATEQEFRATLGRL